MEEQWDFRDAETLGDFFQALVGKKGIEGNGCAGNSCWPGHLGHPFLQDVAAQTLLDGKIGRNPAGILWCGLKPGIKYFLLVQQ